MSEGQKAERTGRASEAKYSELVENATDMIYTVDIDGNFTSVNKACEDIAGYTPGEAMAMNTADLIAPEYMASDRENGRRKTRRQENACVRDRDHQQKRQPRGR